MTAFGHSWGKRDFPAILLFLAIPAVLIIRENNTIFWYSDTVRVITISLSLLFCFITIPFLKKNPVKYISPSILLTTSGFLLVTIISSTLADYPFRNIARLTELFSLTMLALYIRAAVVEGLISILLVPISMVVTLGVLLLGIANYWGQIPDPQLNHWVSKLPFFNNIRHLGYILAILSPIGFILWENGESNRKLRWLSIIFSCLCWSLLIWSGGRGAALATIVVIVLYACLRPKCLIWIIPTMLMAALIAEYFRIDQGSLDLFRTFREFNEQTFGINELSSNRMKIYSDSLQIWWQEGFWLGLGADAFRFINPPIVSASFVHPHSVIVQSLFNYGLIGTLILTVILFQYIYRVIKCYSKSTLIYALPVIAATINGATDGVFYHAISLFYFAILVATSFHKKANVKKDYVPDFNKAIYSFLRITISTTLLLTSLAAAMLAIQIYNAKKPVSEPYASWNSNYPIYYNAYYWAVNLSEQHSSSIDLMAVTASRYSQHPCMVINEASNNVREKFLPNCRGNNAKKGN